MITPEQIEAVEARAPVAEGYRFELLERAEIAALIRLIATWFPGIRVGSASGYLRRASTPSRCTSTMRARATSSCIC